MSTLTQQNKKAMKGVIVKYCENCSMPTEYCKYNTSKQYKNCIRWLSKNNPHSADKLASINPPIIQIKQCGISKINGIYSQKSSLEPFIYVNYRIPSISIIRCDINEINLKKVWIIIEKSKINKNMMIHHYISNNKSIYPPKKYWKCVAGIYPLPGIQHIDSNNKKRVKSLFISKKEEIAKNKLIKLWKEYPKMNTLFNTLFMKQINDLGLTSNDIKWVATEKVHGANLSFITDGKYVLYGKRTSLLDEFTDGFYKGWQDIVKLNKLSIIKTFNHIKTNIDKNVSTIIVYGELFGGNYFGDDDFKHVNDPNIDINKKYVHIQKGVSYSPYHHFYPFDILIISNNNEYFLSFDKTLNVFKNVGFKIYAKIIMEGNLETLMNFDPNKFETTIPSLLNLPKPIKQTIAEGVVLRTKYNKRICIKYKADMFGEINKKYNIGIKLLNDRSISTLLSNMKVSVLNICNNNHDIINLIYQCINKNKLSSVTSKYGTINNKNINKIIGNFTADVWNEINLIHQTKINVLSISDQVTIKKFITELIRIFLSKSTVTIANK